MQRQHTYREALLHSVSDKAEKQTQYTGTDAVILAYFQSKHHCKQTASAQDCNEHATCTKMRLAYGPETPCMASNVKVKSGLCIKALSASKSKMVRSSFK